MIFAILAALLPVFIILGIIDFRFHNYFWPDFDYFRIFHPFAMFDFFSILDAFVMIVALAATISIIFNILKKRDLDYFKEFRWIYLAILFIGCGVIAAKGFYYPVEPMIKSFWFQSYINYVSPVVLFLSILFGIRNKKFLNILIKSVTITFAVFAVVCMFEYFTGLLPGESVDFLGRLAWPYIDPFFGMKVESANYLSYLFGPVCVLSAVSVSLKKLKKSWLEILCFILCGTALILTKSYTGIGITFAIVAYIFFINIPKKAKVWMVVICMTIAGIFIATQWNTRKFQILLGHYGQENSIERRAQIYTFNSEAFLRMPISGIGPGNYQNFFRQNVEDFTGFTIPEIEIPPHPHNIAIAFWSDLGILGLIGIFIIYVGVLFESFFRKGEKKLSSMYFLVPLYFLGHGLLDLPYGTDENSIMFWAFLAIAFIFKA